MCAVLNCCGPERQRGPGYATAGCPRVKWGSVTHLAQRVRDTAEHLRLPFNRGRWVIDCSWRWKAGVCLNIVIHRYITWFTPYGKIHCVQISIFTVISTITWQWYDQQWHLSHTMELSTQHKTIFTVWGLHNYVMNCEMGINVACPSLSIQVQVCQQCIVRRLGGGVREIKTRSKALLIKSLTALLGHLHFEAVSSVNSLCKLIKSRYAY